MAKNQCDGCARGLPMKNGSHYNPDGSYDYIGCTKHLYTDTLDPGVAKAYARTAMDRMMEQEEIA